MSLKFYTLLFALLFMSNFDALDAQSFDSTFAVKLQNSLNTIVTTSNLKGVSGAVFVPGQGTWEGSSGISSPGVPVVPEMRFGIGSNTKLFTAVALLKLQEQGVLSLDDSLGAWLPDFQYVDPGASIRQLLTHQSGIFDFLNDNFSIWSDSIWADQNRFWTPEELLATIGPQEFVAGRGYEYSNTGYLLAGMVLEAATGKSWAQNVRELILDPLGLNETFAGAFETPNGPVANEWASNTQEIVNSPMIAEFSTAHAAGALLSTGADMTHWYSELFGGNVLSAASMREMLDFDPTTFYGLGVGTQYFTILPEAPFVVLVHTGGMLGYNSLTFFDPKTKITAFFVSNIRLPSGDAFNTFIIDIYKNFPKKDTDAGIVKVTKPWATVCGPSVQPTVTLRNFGKDTLHTVAINYGFAGAMTTFNWTGTLSPLFSATVNLPAIAVSSGQNDLICFTALPNGVGEGYHFNDTAMSRFLVVDIASSAFPLSENFDALASFPPDGWSLNSNNLYAWGRTKLASSSGLHAATKSNYNDPNFGAAQDLILPALDCSNLMNATLTFNYAYTTYPGYYDSLRVQISEDCGASWQTLFYSGGVALRTAPEMTAPFYPKPDEWKPKKLALNSTGSEVLLRFRSLNRYGNNLFVDDIQVLDDASVAVSQITAPSNFEVFPNPAASILSIEGLPDVVEFKITNASGATVLRGITDSDKTSVDISQLPTGFYVLQTGFGAKKWVKI
ncbi:MAG: serine hydrolase [Phycisphaerae bacterium]|nr:serine hydrolase [Saprospiraceae bacterium]